MKSTLPNSSALFFSPKNSSTILFVIAVNCGLVASIPSIASLKVLYREIVSLFKISKSSDTDAKLLATPIWKFSICDSTVITVFPIDLNCSSNSSTVIPVPIISPDRYSISVPNVSTPPCNCIASFLLSLIAISFSCHASIDIPTDFSISYPIAFDASVIAPIKGNPHLITFHNSCSLSITQ